MLYHSNSSIYYNIWSNCQVLQAQGAGQGPDQRALTWLTWDTADLWGLLLYDHNWWPQIFTSYMCMICFVSFLNNIFKYTIEIYIHWLGPENKFKKWKTEFLLNLFSGSSKTQKRGKKVHTLRIKIVMFYHGKTIIALRYTMGINFISSERSVDVLSNAQNSKVP